MYTQAKTDMVSLNDIVLWDHSQQQTEMLRVHVYSVGVDITSFRLTLSPDPDLEGKKTERGEL